MKNMEVLYSSVVTIYVIKPQHQPNNVEIIQANCTILWGRVYKPLNERFSFWSDLRTPHMNVVIGDFNSLSAYWGYRSTDENDTLVERWSESYQISLVPDA